MLSDFLFLFRTYPALKLEKLPRNWKKMLSYLLLPVAKIAGIVKLSTITFIMKKLIEVKKLEPE